MTAKLAHLLLSPFCCLWGEKVITSQIVDVAEVHGSLPDGLEPKRIFDSVLYLQTW